VRSLSNVFAIRVSGMSRSVVDGEVVGDLSIDTYRPRTRRDYRDVPRSRIACSALI
jgi:hypothetical protein